MRVLCLAALAALAGAASADQLDDFIQAEMKRQNVPGLTLAIIKDGQIVRTGAYGKADLELDVPTNIDNVFEIGSITKQFTASLTMMMVDEGKLSLDDLLSKFVEGTPDTWKDIKIRNLLNHNSGLKEYVVIPGLMLTDEFEPKTFLEKVKPLPLDFPTGVTHAYSNTNYALLGMVLEKVSGKPYPELLNERILKPLELKDTRILDPREIVKNRAHGYMNFQGQQIRSEFSKLSMLSDGALLSTAKDLAKWVIAFNTGKVVKQSLYEQMITPGTLNSGRHRPYGFGVIRESLGGRQFIGHHGASAGYSAGSGYFPTAKLGVVVMTNVYAINGQAMVQQIAELLEPSLKADVPKEQSDSDKVRTDRVKQALMVLADNKSDDQFLEPEVTAPMKTDRAAMGPSPYAVLKTMQSMTFLGETPYGQDKLLAYRIVTPTRDFIVRVVWSAAGKIAEVGLRADGPVRPAK